MNSETTNLFDERRRFLERWALLSIAGDMLCVVMGLVLSYWLKFESGWLRFGVIVTDMEWRDYGGHFVVGFGSFMLLLFANGLYQDSLVRTIRGCLLIIFRVSTLWLVLFLGLSIAVRLTPDLSRMFLVLAWLFIGLFLLVWRNILHGLLRSFASSAVLRNRLMIVGWNGEAERLLKSIRGDSGLFYRVVAVGDPEGACRADGGDVEWEHLRGWEEIHGWIAKGMVDVVILANLDGPRGEIERIVEECERGYVQFKLIPNYFQIFLSNLQMESLGNVPLLGVERFPLDQSFNRIVKRCVDIVGALVGLAISVPLIVFFGALVYLESPGPVLFHQRRLGRNGKPFVLHKIRSMRMDAEAGGARWSIENDPRRLRIGAFIREWNIDEVPQFWNVLMGEMSLVGPRPENADLTDKFSRKIPHYNARHNAKPGLTGWAQIHGYRGNTDLEKRIQYDLYYLEKWNVWLDFYIMLATIFSRKNAY